MAIRMKSKLRTKAKEGRSGGLDSLPTGTLTRLLREHVERLCDGDSRQAVDVCNIAMMLWVQAGSP